MPAEHESLEVRLPFPELRPGLVGPFELEVRGDLGRDVVDRDPAPLNVEKERRVAIRAGKDDLRGDGRGFLSPIRVRIQATCEFVEECLREVSDHGRPLCGPEAGGHAKASVGVSGSIETGKGLRTAVSARPRVGSQARSKARDSRSLPAGGPRFESWPTHRIRPVPRVGCTETPSRMHDASRDTRRSRSFSMVTEMKRHSTCSGTKGT